MIFYASRTYSARTAGHAVRTVTCEKCRCKFTYYIFRQASGSGHSPYMLDNHGAAQRASNEANGWLHRMLSTHTEPVPCPDCGWFQADMLQQARTRPGMWPGWYAPWLPTVNVQWPCPPVAAPGAPYPIRLEPGTYSFFTAASGNTQLPRFVDPGGGMVLQLTELSLPGLCCSCLKTPVSTYVLNLAGGRLSVPICQECGQLHKGPSGGKYLLFLLALPAVVFGLMAIVAAIAVMTLGASAGLNVEQKLALSTFPAALCAAIAFVIGLILVNRRRPAPVFVSGADLTNGVARIAFLNHGYTQALQAHLAQQPLRAPQ